MHHAPATMHCVPCPITHAPCLMPLKQGRSRVTVRIRTSFPCFSVHCTMHYAQCTTHHAQTEAALLAKALLKLCARLYCTMSHIMTTTIQLSVACCSACCSTLILHIAHCTLHHHEAPTLWFAFSENIFICCLPLSSSLVTQLADLNIPWKCLSERVTFA